MNMVAITVTEQAEGQYKMFALCKMYFLDLIPCQNVVCVAGQAKEVISIT